MTVIDKSDEGAKKMGSFPYSIENHTKTRLLKI